MRSMLGVALVVAVFVPSMVSTAAQNPPLKFDVASVKPSEASAGRSYVGCYTPTSRLNLFPKGMCVARNMTLRSIIKEAYDLNVTAFNMADYIQGGPGWVGSDRFDFDAKAEDVSATTDQLLAMLRNLLAERFKLQIHEERKDESGYALVVGRNGPKLTPTTGDKPVSVYAAGQPPKEFRGLNAEMAVVAGYLSRRFNPPIVDRTGLTGRYDFKVALLTDDATHSLNESDIHAVAKALEQLGLHLQPEELPVVRLMIDHAEKPDAN